MSYTTTYLNETAQILRRIDDQAVEQVARLLAETHIHRGRVFFLGVGGSAANCSHAVNDFRKIAGFEAYTPTDNVAELTARTNDDGWHSTFVEWLKGSRLCLRDIIFVFSVGGGTSAASENIVQALSYAQRLRTGIVGIVGQTGGYTAEVANAVIRIPTVNPEMITPHVEECQAIIWHLIVNHPLVKRIR